MMTAECLRTYSLRINGNGEITGADQPDEELNALVHEFAAEHGIGYNDAMSRIRANPKHSEVVRRYDAFAGGGTMVDLDPMDGSINDPLNALAIQAARAPGRNGAAEVVLARAQKLMEESGDDDLQKAVSQVLGSDSELRDRYAVCTGG